MIKNALKALAILALVSTAAHAGTVSISQLVLGATAGNGYIFIADLDDNGIGGTKGDYMTVDGAPGSLDLGSGDAVLGSGNFVGVSYPVGAIFDPSTITGYANGKEIYMLSFNEPLASALDAGSQYNPYFVGVTVGEGNDVVVVGANTFAGGYNRTLTPEPASLALFGLGGLLIARRRRA